MREMTGVNEVKAILLRLLEVDNPADAACRVALQEGAIASLPGEAVAISSLVPIYSRRLDHLRSKGTRFIGGDAIDRLRNSGADEVLITSVHGARDTFVVFITPDKTAVAGCVGIDSAVANQDFTWPG